LINVLKNESTANIATRLAGWRLEATSVRLDRIAEHAKRLAGRLGKGSIDIHIEHGGLLIEAKYWASFWSAIIHVVRNAIDHGIETVDERIAKGKSPNGALRIKTAIEAERFVVSIADDGRGIDWERVRLAAEQHGQSVETRQDLFNAIFKDGVTTAPLVTDTSGRGVGMSAIRQATQQLGGEISIHTRANQGSEFCFEFPLAAMAPETNSLFSRYGIKKAFGLAVSDLSVPPLEIGNGGNSPIATLAT
jgi:chemotaxis protein histidine kinase CheA